MTLRLTNSDQTTRPCPTCLGKKVVAAAPAQPPPLSAADELREYVESSRERFAERIGARGDGLVPQILRMFMDVYMPRGPEALQGELDRHALAMRSEGAD